MTADVLTRRVADERSPTRSQYLPFDGNSQEDITLRYPYNGDTYTADGKHHNKSGYFDDCGRWLEGELKVADPTFCRFLSSSWIVEQDPAKRSVVSKKSAE